MTRDYYSILGVSKNSNKKDIISAFRKLARKFHPDVNKKNSYNEQKFKEINQAYQVLSDDKTRKDYDDFGNNWLHADQIRSNGISNSFKYKKDLDRDFFSFNDFFNFNNRSKSNFENSNSHKIEISVTLKDLCFGTKKIITIKEKINCDKCNIDEKFQSIKCTFCDGSGKKLKSKNIEFKIPKGMKNEGIIKLRRPDSKVINIVIKEVKENNFVRKNNDLFTKVKVDYLDAILGGEVIVDTLDKPISLKIPAVTKNLTLFKIKNKGMPELNSNNIGSLIVEINISIPSEISNHEKDILEKLRISKRGNDAL